MKRRCLKMWITWLGFMSLLICTYGQSDPGFKHELPPGVELVNPKDFGLTDADLGKFLGNVKVLGGSQIGDTKTQILTVGFDGDEDLNFDDFEIPGLTDKKAANMPDKDKEIANVAFEKFKEFFKDPNKNAQAYKESKSNLQPQAQISSAAPAPLPPPPHPQRDLLEPQQNNNNRPSQSHLNHNYKPLPRPSPQALQQHYPVTLTQPNFQAPTTPRPPLIQHHPQNQPPNVPYSTIDHSQLPPELQKPKYVQNPRDHGRHMSQNSAEAQKNYITPVISAQQSLQSQNHHQNRPPPNQNPNSHSSHLEFGAKLSTSLAPTYTQKPNKNIHNHNHNHNKPFSTYQNQVNVPENKPQPTHYTPQHTNSNNFPRFPENPQKPPKNPGFQTTTDPNSVGQIVRNQLIFNANSNSYFSQPPPPPPQEQNPQYPSPSPSSSIPLLQRLPQDSQQRPVSHVYIHHQNQNVQQTSFHPRFKPPTNFVNNFTPSVNHITTPAPIFDVTPSMPMILISTNENAITDPERMERLRQQQRHREELRLREEQRFREEALKNEQRQRQASEQNSQQLQQQHQQPQTQPPLQYSNSNQAVQQTQPPKQFSQNQNTYHQHQQQNQQSTQSNYNNGNNYGQYRQHQNSFNFQAQQQQHQLHTLQSHQSYNYNYEQMPQITYYQNHHPLPPQNQQNQQQAQPSTNFQQLQFPPRPTGYQQPPPLPRFPTRPDPQQYYGKRHKRGYRHMLTSLLRGLWRAGDRD